MTDTKTNEQGAEARQHATNCGVLLEQAASHAKEGREKVAAALADELAREARAFAKALRRGA